MKKTVRTLITFLPGALGGVLAVLLSRLLLRNLDAAVLLAGKIIGLNQQNLTAAVQILAQLNTAELSSNWLPAAAFASVCGFCLLRIRPKVISVLLWLLLLVLTLAAALWFTQVNGVQVGALLKVLLPLIPHL